MFLDERREKILEILHKNGKVFVKDLAETFSVGEGMIRKDLQALEKENKLKRTYGGAIVKNELVHRTTLNERIAEANVEKEIIAEKLFNIVEEGDTIFLDISSTNYILAKKLAQSKKEVLIITNMPNTLAFFSENDNLSVILIGGTYNKKIGGTVGSEAIKAISDFKIDKAFIGSCGINFESFRVTNFDLEDGNTKKAVISLSNEKYLIAESKKFDIEGFFCFANLKDFDYIVTEKVVMKEFSDRLKDTNVKFI